jgi:hypothetical protein
LLALIGFHARSDFGGLFVGDGLIAIRTPLASDMNMRVGRWLNAVWALAMGMAPSWDKLGPILSQYLAESRPGDNRLTAIAALLS